MKYTIIFLALATISCSESSPKEAPKNDTVIIDYLRGTDTIIYDTVQLDTVEVKKKACQESIHKQMRSVQELENKLDRIKRKIKQRKERRKKRQGNAYL